MMYRPLIMVLMCTFACRKTRTTPEMIIDKPSMVTSHCDVGLEYCPPPGSTKGVYEAAHSAVGDCLTGCIDANQTEDRNDEDIWKDCALICDQSPYLELIPTPTSIDIQVLE